MLPLLLSTLCLANTEDKPEKTFDPYVAITLSTRVGFGSGHFYTQKPVSGLFFLSSEAASLTVLGIGAIRFFEGFDSYIPYINVDPYKRSFVAYYEPDKENLQAGASLMLGGLTSYYILRKLEVLTVPKRKRSD